MQAIQDFEEMHVVSDLHLGGERGFQIFGLTAELEGLITYLGQKTPSSRLALVINGDFIDFLAEEPFRHFDPHDAITKLDRIAADPTFAPVWKALQAFAAKPERTLLINVGNHDLEIGLPWVREHLIAMLGGSDLAARSRIVVTSDGTGVTCQIGRSRVVCVHGNEVDDWNVADYETIRRIARDLIQGRPVDPWIPNAGTQLVIDVMNSVKQTYPFVDLLKPEDKAVVPTLLALDHRLLAKVPRAVPAAARRGWDRLKMSTGFLEVEEDPSVALAPEGQSRRENGRPVVNEPRVRRVSQRASADAFAKALLDRTEERLRDDEDPMLLADGDEQEQYLGAAGALWNLAKGDVVGALREALEGLEQDRSFEVAEPDATYRALDERIGRQVDFVIAGHTHLERALPRNNGRGYYFNSGTWARLIRLGQSVLNDPKQFQAIYDVFRAGRMEALDAYPNLVQKRPTFVSVWAEGAKTCAELRRFKANGGSSPYVPVDDSHFELA